MQGSTCIGFDCVANENFGFDTLRLKENNLRMHFEDTSASAGFASNDWRFVFNADGTGGASYFALEDSTAAQDALPGRRRCADRLAARPKLRQCRPRNRRADA